MKKSFRLSKLRLLREARGLSLRAAAEMARIDPAQLSRLERGEGGLSLEAAARLARVLGLHAVSKALEPFIGGIANGDG
jgi:transcriptional regulator with XRE-family HTH domain